MTAQALQSFARAANMAGRAGAWFELLNTARKLHGVAGALLAADEELLQPAGRVPWEVALLPSRPDYPVSIAIVCGRSACQLSGSMPHNQHWSTVIGAC